MAKSRRVATERIVSNAGIGDLEELASVYDNPDIDLSTTPFGSPRGEDNLFVKGAVSWKGEEVNDLQNTDALPDKVARGLQLAQDITAPTSGSTGNGSAVDPRTGNEIPGHVPEYIGNERTLSQSSF